MATKSTDTKPEIGDEVFEQDKDGATASIGSVAEVHHGSRRGPGDTGDTSYYVTIKSDDPKQDTRACHVLHDGSQFNVL